MQQTPSKHKVAVVFGTRPEAIKLAPLVRNFLQDEDFEISVISTGQHKELLQPLYKNLNISPDVEFDSMVPGQSLGETFSSTMNSLSHLFVGSKFDLVIVQGDTSTALAGALAAFYAGKNVAHIEAGLRSENILNPFPEEANRQLITRITNLNFAPTNFSGQNLINDGVPLDSIHVVGNTGIDNLFWEIDQNRGVSPFKSDHFKILVTLHRRENQNGVIAEICKVLADFASNHECEIVLPLHKSPVVRDAILSITRNLQNFHTPEALAYSDFLTAMRDADLVLTDSGGVQEEAPSLGKRVIVLRETTERQEGVLAGTSLLLGTRPSALSDLLKKAFENPMVVQVDAKNNPYGDGRSSARIIEAIRNFLSKKNLDNH